MGISLAWLALVAALAGCASSVSDQGALEQELTRAIASREGVAPTRELPAQALGTGSLEVMVAPSPLRGAGGLACQGQALLVTEPLADRISEVKPDGSVSHLATPSDLTEPRALAFLENGALVVTTGEAGEIWRRSPDGQWERLSADLPEGNGIAPAAGGLLITQCADGGRLVMLESGAVRVRAQGLGCPGELLVQPDGTAIIPLRDRGEVIAVDPAGSKRVLATNLQTPSAVALAPDGRAVVAESASGEISALSLPAGSAAAAREAPLAKLAPGLADLLTCGETLVVSSAASGSLEAFKPWPGSRRTLVAGGLVVPGGLAFDGDDLVIADTASIKRIKRGGIELLLVAGSGEVPPLIGLTGGLPGIVWATSPERGEVLEVDLTRRKVSTVASGLDWPTSVVRTLQGDLIVAETGAGRVVRIDAGGIPQTIASGLLSPIGLALRGEEVLTAEPDGGRVLALREGEPPAVVLSELSGPAGLAVGPDGKLYVAERGNGRIVRRSSGGTVAGIAIGIALGARNTLHPLPVPLAVAADGTLIVASPEDGSVLRITPD